jgi:hypothetical protein
MELKIGLSNGDFGRVLRSSDAQIKDKLSKEFMNMS